MRRLQSEYEAMLDFVSRTSLVTFEPRGLPPTRYEVTAICTGIQLVDQTIILTNLHQFDIQLGADFPALPPAIVWKTPVFHPNIRPPSVCPGDFWYPACSIAELCERLCDMIQYKNFNVYDPLDRDAAAWLYLKLQSDDPRIPIDPRPLFDLEFDIHPTVRSTPEDG